MDWSVLKNPTLAVTGVVYGLLGAISLYAGIFGMWLGILLILSLWRYGYELLRTVAQGRSFIPPPDLQSLNPVGEIVLLLHFVAFPGVVIIASRFPPFGTLIAILAASVFPASAAVMGLTSNIQAAFSPAAIGAFISTLGRSYVVLVLGCVGVTIAAAVIERVVFSQLGFLSFVLGMMLEVWTFLAIFALIGSSLHAHRLHFGIPGEKRTSEEWEAERRQGEWRATLDRAYASIRSGLVDSGYRTLKELIADNGGGIEIQYWVVENMLEWEDKRHAMLVAAKLIAHLVANGDMAGALDLYTRCARQAKTSGTLPSEVAAALADYADSVGRQGTASELRAL